jgi:hypothetical protein
MEEYFQILIWLFIIFSFLSSFFRKKKQRQSQQQQQEPPPRREPSRDVSTPQNRTKAEPGEDYDILKEIESLFKTPQQTGEPKVKGREAEEVEIPHGYFEVESDKPSLDEPVYVPPRSIENQWDKKRRMMEESKKRLDAKVLNTAAEFEKRLKRKKIEDSKYRKSLMGKMKHPETLKEYIIFSEILGKPKSMRR